MQSTTSKRTIEVKLKDKSETLPIETYSRWLCLIEAIELVCNKAKQMKIDTANNIDWIKPLAFQKYIDERHESMVDEIEMYEKQEDLSAQPTAKLCNTHQELASK
jgi:adenylate kinase family enzyme